MNFQDNFWYAVYTKPRCEKRVHEKLLQKGFESYCPLQKVRKRWTDRYKVIEEPLFKSYTFIKIKETEKPEIRLTEGVVNFVYWLGKPAVINEEDINTIKRFLKEYKSVSAEKLDFKEQQHIQITAGLLMDHKAIVKRVMKNKVVAELLTIGFRITAEVNKNDVIILENNFIINE
jgi:transcription antitermination factor NusG